MFHVRDLTFDSDDDEALEIDSHSVHTDKNGFMLAFTTRKNDLYVYHCRSSKFLPKATTTGNNEKKVASKIDRIKFTDDENVSVPCMCISPNGRWVALVQSNAKIVIMATSLVLSYDIGGDVKNNKSSCLNSTLFNNEPVTTIQLKTRDDGLHLASCVVWYEGIVARRPILIISNKGGDILIIDLTLKKLSASLQAPQSIHRLRVFYSQNAEYTDAYLIVTGFTQNQWVIPLETDGQTVRETLSKILPAELKDFKNTGMYTLTSTPRKINDALPTIAQLERKIDDSTVFRIFSNMQMKTTEVELPLSVSCVTHVAYTPQVTCCVAADNTLASHVNLDEKLLCTNEAVRRLLCTQFHLDDAVGAILDIAALRFVKNAHYIPEFVVVAKHAIKFLVPRYTTSSLFALLCKSIDASCRNNNNCLALMKSFGTALCNTFDINLNDTATFAIRDLLMLGETPRKSSSSLIESTATQVAVKIAETFQLPVTDVATMFVKHNLEEHILPLAMTQQAVFRQKIDLSSDVGISQQAELNQLTALVFDLQLRVLNKSDAGYERTLHTHNLKLFLNKNRMSNVDTVTTWLVQLLQMQEWQCASALLPTDGELNGVNFEQEVARTLAKTLTVLEKWTLDDIAFVRLATHEILLRHCTTLLLKAPCSELVEKWLTVLPDCHKKEDALEAIVRMTDWHRRPEIRELIDLRRRNLKDDCASLSDAVIELHLLALVHLTAFRQEKMLKEEENRRNRAKKNAIKGAQPVVPMFVQEIGAGISHTVLSTTQGLMACGNNSKPCVLGSCELDKEPRPSSSLPRQVDGQERLIDRQVQQVACGAEHTLVLTTDGLVYAFGRNRHGQLGTGNRQDSPALKSIKMSSKASSISAGHYHSAAIDRSGRVYTWGWAIHGQLAHGRHCLTNQLTPKLVARLPDADPIVQVACGHAHTVFLTVGGVVYTSGCGAYGQLGIDIDERQKDIIDYQRTKKSNIPVKLLNLSPYRITQIGSGHFHSVAWSQCGNLFTWGATPQSLKMRALIMKRNRAQMREKEVAGEKAINLNTTVFDDTDRSHCSPRLIEHIPTLLKAEGVTSIACGVGHTALLTSNYKLYTYGKGLEYQLGHGDKTERNLPSLVSSVHDIHQWNAVACGADYTVSVDRRCNIWSWGHNDVKQLGFPALLHEIPQSPKSRTLTISKGGKGPMRTISIGGRNERNYQARPYKLPVLKTLGYLRLKEARHESPCLPSPSSDAGSMLCVDSSPSLVHQRCIDVKGLYEATKITAATSNDAKKLCPLVWIASDRPFNALELQCRLSMPLNRQQIDDVIDLYEASMQMTKQRDESLACARLIVAELPCTSIQHLEGALLKRARENEHWCQLLTETVIKHPTACTRLSSDFCLDLLELVIQAKRNSDDDANYLAISNKAIDLIDVDNDTKNQNTSMFVFGRCGHCLTESTLQTEIGTLQAHRQINIQLPRAAAHLQRLFDDLLTKFTGRHLTTQNQRNRASLINCSYCPTCLSKLLAHVIVQQ